jgi:serine/threonine protein phosphatase PrpC
VLYGVFDGLTELAHRLGEWDRRRIGEALGRWREHPHEKVRRKAAFLAALVGTPEALRELGVSPEGVPEDVAERRRFLRRILEEKGS